MMIISGGAEIEAAVVNDLLVVHASPEITEAQWDEALSQYRHLNAYLVGEMEDVDGTEIFFFQIPERRVA